MQVDISERIEALLVEQKLGVLATSLDGHPYTTLVAFASGEDMTTLCFATSRATRKFANLGRDERVSLLIDNRRNRDEDFRKAEALTVLGQAAEASTTEREEWNSRYLRKHPSLREFLNAPNCALFLIRVDRYCLVDHFQNVVELQLRP